MNAIDRYVERLPDSPVLHDLLGTSDPRVVEQRALDLDPEATEIFFFAASVGAVFGLVRADGSRVAMKINKRFADEQARDQPFTAAERRTALAAAVYLRAYAERCGHAYGRDAKTSGLATYAEKLLTRSR